MQDGFKIQNVRLKGWDMGVPKTAEILSTLFLTKYSWDLSEYFLI